MFFFQSVALVKIFFGGCFHRPSTITIRSFPPFPPVTVGKVESRSVAEAGLVESKLAGAAIEEYKSKMFGVFLTDMELLVGDFIPLK